MKIINSITGVKRTRQEFSSGQKKVGLVPTMGALHEGHLSLVKQAKRENDIVSVSIFVNPIQFNDKNDLRNYPRELDKDLLMLAGILEENDFVFCPDQDEMYPEPVNKTFDFGNLDSVMEGFFRPGHFNGVGIVVEKLFRIIEPDRAYFGIKDFQQLAVIRKMAEIENFDIDIIGCPIIREENGLAMSSRNKLLNPDLRKKAGIIFESISKARDIGKRKTVSETVEEIKKSIQARPGFVVEYIEIRDSRSLEAIRDWDDSDSIRCFAAVIAGSVRLIDNVEISL